MLPKSFICYFVLSIFSFHKVLNFRKKSLEFGGRLLWLLVSSSVSRWAAPFQTINAAHPRTRTCILARPTITTAATHTAKTRCATHTPSTVSTSSLKSHCMCLTFFYFILLYISGLSMAPFKDPAKSLIYWGYIASFGLFVIFCYNFPCFKCCISNFIVDVFIVKVFYFYKNETIKEPPTMVKSD